MLDRALKVSSEVYLTLHIRKEGDESFDGLLRRILELEPRVKRQVGPTAIKPDKRQKYPIVGMKPGDSLTFPWNRDKHGNAAPEIRGVNSSVSRCNRMPGRKYKAIPTSSGLLVTRLE